MNLRNYRARWAWLAVATICLALAGAWLSADTAFAGAALSLPHVPH